MEMKQLRQFRTIVQAGGLTKAAAILHLTPGALSKSMRQLEGQLGQTVFSRSGRSLVLTGAGRRLYRRGERLLAEHEALLKSLDSSELASPTLRIASFEVFTTHCLGALAAADPRIASGLEILELPLGNIGKAVLRGDADLGVTYAPFPDRDLKFKRLTSIDFGIFVRRGAFRKTPFAELPFAIPTTPLSGTPAEMLGIDSWPYERVSRLVKYRLTSLESALELVRRGECAVFIPVFVAGLHNATVRRELRIVRRQGPPRLRRVAQSAYLVTRPEDSDAVTTKRFGRALVEVIDSGMRKATSPPR